MFFNSATFCVSVFTDKSILLKQYIFKCVLKLMLFKTHGHFNPDKLCVTTSYIQDDIMIVFTMAFKCVLKILKTCVNFTGLQEEVYFCSRKMFSCRKLTDVETLLLDSNFFN